MSELMRTKDGGYVRIEPVEDSWKGEKRFAVTLLDRQRRPRSPRVVRDAERVAAWARKWARPLAPTMTVPRKRGRKEAA